MNVSKIISPFDNLEIKGERGDIKNGWGYF